jgi:hypothetical protein
MHQKATGVSPWMNGFRCRVPLHGRANPEKKETTAVKPWSFKASRSLSEILLYNPISV